MFDTATPTQTVTVIMLDGPGYDSPAVVVLPGEADAATVAAAIREQVGPEYAHVTDSELGAYLTDSEQDDDYDGEGYGPGGWVITEDTHTIPAPRIDVIVSRDPDGPTHVRVYRDGDSITCENDTRANIVSVDPGAGWTVEGWAAARDDAAERVHPALTQEVRDTYESWGERVEVEGAWGNEADSLRGEVAMWLRDAGHEDHADAAGAVDADTVRQWINDAEVNLDVDNETQAACKIIANVVLAQERDNYLAATEDDADLCPTCGWWEPMHVSVMNAIRTCRCGARYM